MKKEPPDHAPRAFELRVHFSPEFAASLAAEFNIPQHFNLLSRLNDTGFWYQVANQSRPPPGSEQKELLTVVHSRARELEELLNKLGREELDKIFKAMPAWGSYHSLTTHLNAFKNATGAASQNVAVKRGRRPDDSLRNLILNLHEIYQGATGDGRRVTWDQYSGSYTGPLVEFVASCLREMAIYKSNQTLGDLLLEILPG